MKMMKERKNKSDLPPGDELDNDDEIKLTGIEPKYDDPDYKDVSIEHRKEKFKLIETNFTIDPESKEIIHEGDRYAKITHFYPTLPKITGMPRITRKVFVRIIKRSPLYRNRYFGYYKTPKECDIKHLVNFPFTKIGAPPINSLGQYRMGKSNLISLLAICWMARKKRFLMFDDMACESRIFAHHGFFNKHSVFTPFKIIYWIPKGYKFREEAENHNPIWNHRNNCELREFQEPIEIIDEMKPYIVNVVYSEAFTEAGLIRLWLDLILEILPQVSISKHYVFFHHEFADMVPESPRGELAELVDKMFYFTRRLPKWRIGILTSFHDSADVSYKISRKYSFTLQKRAIYKKSMSDVELAAKNYSKSEVAISIGGNWRPHTITLFPELPEIYKLIPHRVAFNYPEFTVKEKEPVKKVLDLQKLLTETEYDRYMRYVDLGKSYLQIAQEDGVKRNSVMDSVKSAFQKINNFAKVGK